MLNSARTRLRGASTIAVLVVAAALAACSTTQPKSMVVPKKKSKEYFSETEYGVKASPRVTTKQTKLARGGGRDQIGKPYKVRGKVYYPEGRKELQEDRASPPGMATPSMAASPPMAKSTT